MSIFLGEMTIKSLFNLSKIPYDSNQSFEDKITILKNAQILHDEEHYSNNLESSQNKQIDNNLKCADRDERDIDRLADFLTGKSDVVDCHIKWLYLPSDKNSEGAEVDNLSGKIYLKKDFYNNRVDQIVEHYYTNTGNLVIGINYDCTGKYSFFDINGSSVDGVWGMTAGENPILNVECKGYSDYYGTIKYFRTKSIKTKGKSTEGSFDMPSRFRIYSESYTKTSENGEFVIDSLARVDIF